MGLTLSTQEDGLKDYLHLFKKVVMGQGKDVVQLDDGHVMQETPALVKRHEPDVTG